MKTMKMNLKSLALLLIATALGAAAFAQGPQEPPKGNKGDRVEALRIAFISEKLNLTPAEAQNFWPVYNQYRNDMETLRKNFKQGADVQPTAEQQLDMEQKKLDLKKKYKSQFEGALGKTKLNQLYNLEHEFHEKLKEMRDQRQQQKGNNPGHGPGSRSGGPGPNGGGRPGGRF